ncbi:response regulator receiver domain protein [delta proteobacterium NaphS2]|nr:response regulator receiver domain protein [delta proteobacterium NaphS2]
MNDASILVVDGDPEIREAIETVLRREGCRVTCEGNAEGALRILRSRSFDTVITDIRMPDIDGLDFLDRVRDVDEHVEIIVLTGFTTIQNVIRVLRDVGAADYLSKPLNDMEELVSAVKRVLRKRKSGK